MSLGSVWLVSCTFGVKKADLVGDWRLRTDQGTFDLTLFEDGSYEERIALKNGMKAVRRAAWKAPDETSRLVVIESFILPQEAIESESQEIGPGSTFTVRPHFELGTAVLEVDPDRGHVFKKLKPS